MKIKEKFSKGKEKIKSAKDKTKSFIEDHATGLIYGGLVAGAGAYLALSWKSNRKQLQRFYDKLLEKDDLNLTYNDKRKFKDCYVLDDPTESD